MASLHIPVSRPLVCSGDKEANLSRFTASFSDYYIATKLDQETLPVQVATLCSILGDDCRDALLTNPLTAAELASTTTYLDALKTRFAPPTNYLFSRYKFETATQLGTENIDQFHTRLRTLAQYCKYQDLTDRIRDRLIFGTNDKLARAELFKATSITLDQVIETLRIFETTKSQLQRVEGTEAPDALHSLQTANQQYITPSYEDQLKDEVYQARHVSQRNLPVPHTNSRGRFQPRSRQSQTSRPGTPGQNRNSNKTCLYCGGHHVLQKTACPAYGKTCTNCGMLNHFQYVCRQPPHAPGYVRQLDEEVPSHAAQSLPRQFSSYEDCFLVKMWQLCTPMLRMQRFTAT